jgi:hypothetical protein
LRSSGFRSPGIAAGQRQAADLHRRRRAEVGAGRHHGEVAGVEDVGAGAGRPCAGGRHVGGDGDGRGEDAADHRAHRIAEAAGRVHAQDDEARAAFLGGLEGVFHQLDGGGSDGAVDLDQQGDGIGIAAGRQAGRRDGTEQQASGTEQPPDQDTHGGPPIRRWKHRGFILLHIVPQD